jgi:predicted Zn-dependent protease
MLSKAATVTSVRREFSSGDRKASVIARFNKEKDKESQQQDARAQQSFWLGVTAASVIQQDNLKKKTQKSRLKKFYRVEKIIQDNTKEVLSPPRPLLTPHTDDHPESSL